MGETGFKLAELGVAVLALFFTVLGGVGSWLIAAAFKVIFGWVQKNKDESDGADSRLDVKIDEVEKRVDEKIKELRNEFKDADGRHDGLIDGLHQELKDVVSLYRANDHKIFDLLGALTERLARVEERMKF